MTYEERQALFRKCRSYPHGDDFPTGWFQSPDIRREDVVLWILWALFSTETHRPEWEEEINEYVSDIENLLGRTFEPGYNDKAKSMRLTFDPVVAAHRPLVWYIVSIANSRQPSIADTLSDTRSSVVSTFTLRSPFGLTGSRTMPLPDGFGASHLGLRPSYPTDLLILGSRTGIVPTAQQRSCPFYFSMALGYGYSRLFSCSHSHTLT